MHCFALKTNPKRKYVPGSLQKNGIEKVLVVGDNNELKGLITVTDFRKAELYPNSCKDDLGPSTCGCGSRYWRRNRRAVLKHWLKQVIMPLCLDMQLMVTLTRRD